MVGTIKLSAIGLQLSAYVIIWDWPAKRAIHKFFNS